MDTFFAYELLETIRIKDCLFLDKHSPAKKPLRGGGIFVLHFLFIKKTQRLTLLVFQIKEANLFTLCWGLMFTSSYAIVVKRNAIFKK